MSSVADLLSFGACGASQGRGPDYHLEEKSGLQSDRSQVSQVFASGRIDLVELSLFPKFHVVRSTIYMVIGILFSCNNSVSKNFQEFS